MRTQLLISGALLVALAGIAKADDHLVQALEHGLTLDSQPFQENKAGRSGDLAPGQGSPFAGEETKTPATDTEAANAHAKVKEREPKSPPASHREGGASMARR
ncbi:hypothetical protein [Mesorhizobium sp. CN2-181]|uniref:hypothetical protein n=1 Tax=Mesorhizobium yinganensis TaxID=3157707 RepID=UPI0032B7C6F8